MAHKHAESMLKYAQDAMEFDKPWERWDVYNSVIGVWVKCGSHPTWDVDFEYRQRDSIINIGQYEFPAPYKGNMKQDQQYYIVCLAAHGKGFDAMPGVWNNTHIERNALASGLIHISLEAANQHANVLNKISLGEV